MPSIPHEGLVELVRQHPPLGVELLRHVGVFALPAEVTAVLGSEDMSDVTPRANSHGRQKAGPQKYTADSVVVVSDAISGKRLLAIVVEPQGRASGPRSGRRCDYRHRHDRRSLSQPVRHYPWA
jgi:hypothetical protein